MGNCLFPQGADDQSLLNESEGGSLPGEAAHRVSRWGGGQLKSTPGTVAAPANGVNSAEFSGREPLSSA